MGPTGATLSGSFSGATGRIHNTGFEFATSEAALDGTGNGASHLVYDDTNVGEVASGSISATLGSLSPSTTYYYRAFVAEYNKSTGVVDYRYGAVKSFTTLVQSESPSMGWLELPAKMNGSGFVEGYFGTGKNRNYSYHYDTGYYTALWTAYPLTSSHINGSASTSSWNYNSDVDSNFQINVKSSSYGTNYGDDTYSRGHQIPAADRKCDDIMRGQTYLLTNQTPQILKFNSPMWSNLEQAVRDLTSSTDTVYVVTGAAFQKVGETKAIETLTAAKVGITPTTIYIPNYYWKVILKVKRSGSTITNAKAIGIWMEHTTYSSQTAWQSATCSVSQIQQWTGFDFFVNLPGDSNSGIEAIAESNTSWASFQSF